MFYAYPVGIQRIDRILFEISEALWVRHLPLSHDDEKFCRAKKISEWILYLELGVHSRCNWKWTNNVRNVIEHLKESCLDCLLTFQYFYSILFIIIIVNLSVHVLNFSLELHFDKFVKKILELILDMQIRKWTFSKIIREHWEVVDKNKNWETDSKMCILYMNFE